MKRILVIFLLALTACSLAQAQTTKEHEAIRLVKEMHAALVNGDLAAYLSHITDDAFNTDQNAGLRTKEATAQLLTGRKYERYDLDELKVRDYGEVAIVTGHFSRKIAGTNREGKPLGEEQGRFTSVWVKRGGRWMRDVYHQSVLPPKAP
jgi:ketosteroid isomerase-like protein